MSSFFTAPSEPLPVNCAMTDHEKTIMLNADMVQTFRGNHVLDVPALDIGSGVERGIVRTSVTHPFSQIAPRVK